METGAHIDVVVAGAGLAGLTAAHELHRGGMSVQVIEARGRVGGRIMTVAPAGAGEEAWVDVGATWLWVDQPEVRALSGQLNLVTFPQYRSGRALAEEEVGSPPTAVDVPPPSPAELRLAGGAQQLCFGLADRLPEGAISYATRVAGVALDHDLLTIDVVDAAGGRSDLTADFVVVALPPRLVRQNIRFAPALPADLVQVMEATPTWMGTALKCVAVYESAFWRAAGWSGLAFSSHGPLIEVHDGCTDDAAVAALWGFVSADHAFRDLPSDRRTELVLDHLGRLFGPPAADPVQYVERDWANDPNTNDEVIWVGEPRPYGDPAFARPALNGRLVWAGAETVAEGGGHMEGAVRSGRRAAATILAPAAGPGQ